MEQLDILFAEFHVPRTGPGLRSLPSTSLHASALDRSCKTSLALLKGWYPRSTASPNETSEWAMPSSWWLKWESSNTGLSANFPSERAWQTEQTPRIEMLFDRTFPWLPRHVKSRQYTAWLMNLEYLECSEQIRGGRKSHSDLPFQWKWSKWLISKPLRRKSCTFLLRTAHKGSPRRLLGRDYQQHWSFQKHAKEAIHHACGATK